eukprot:2767878-Pyramimonas_sp.AAC.1
MVIAKGAPLRIAKITPNFCGSVAPRAGVHCGTRMFARVTKKGKRRARIGCNRACSEHARNNSKRHQPH